MTVQLIGEQPPQALSTTGFASTVGISNPRTRGSSAGDGVRVGVVLGGGGDVGVAYMAGCLTAVFQATGWNPSDAQCIVGTSAGSLMAVTLTLGLPPKDLHATMMGAEVSPRTGQLLTDDVMGRNELPPITADALVNPRLNGLSVLPRALLRGRGQTGPMAASVMPEGRFDTSFVRNKVLRMTGASWPQQPLYITATRMDDGEREVFSDGTGQPDLATAVAASCAIPAVFKPVTVTRRKYVDGGMGSSTNADILEAFDVDVALILAPSSAQEPLSWSLTAPMRLAARRKVDEEAAQLRSHGTRALVFQPDRATVRAMGVNLMDTRKRPTVSRLARRAAMRTLAVPGNADAVRILRSAARTDAVAQAS